MTIEEVKAKIFDCNRKMDEGRIIFQNLENERNGLLMELQILEEVEKRLDKKKK